MKDRFRVRAWNEVGKYYLYDVQNSIYSHNRQRYTFVDAVNKELLKKWKLEQCSGIRDKNGQLIYEGDIVYVDEYVYYSEPLTLVIAFHNGAFLAGDRYIDNNSVHMKIIGNIHENPELLEGK